MWTMIAAIGLAGMMILSPNSWSTSPAFIPAAAMGLLLVFVVFALENRKGRLGRPTSVIGLGLTALAGAAAFWFALRGPLIITRQLNLVAVMGSVLGVMYLRKRRAERRDSP